MDRYINGVNKNIGFMFKVTFPVCNDGTHYYFQTPTDFGKGGVSMMDGTVMKKHTKDISLECGTNSPRGS